MATCIKAKLVDDFAATDIPRGPSVRFGIDGRNYEVDLTDENAAALRAKLDPFAAAGRRVTAALGRARR